MCVNTIYPRKERAANEAEYTQNGEGCYIPGCQTAEGWICLDGTRAFSYVGRFSNHAPRSVATLTPYKPLLISNRWRAGFLAARNIQKGEEPTWDYGCAPGLDEAM